MRNPTTHKFLAWAGPTSVLFIGGCLALVATFAQTYDGVKNWAQRLFDQWWPVVSAPWFLIVGTVVICAYIWALVRTGQEPKPKPKSGIWLYGEGLEHVKVSREASGPFEAKFFPLPEYDGLVDQVIAAKDQSNKVAIERRMSVETWVPLDEAVRYLAKRSQWGTTQKPTDPHLPTNVGIQLRDALVCGDLTARGRQYHVLKGGIKDPPMHPLMPIPISFWQTAVIQAYWPLQGRVQSIASRGVESVVRKGDHEGMHDVRLNRPQLEALWPPQSNDAQGLLGQYTDQHWSVQDEIALEGRRRGEQESGYEKEAAWQMAADQTRAIERDVSLSEALTYHVEGKWGCRYFDSVAAGRSPDGLALTQAIQLAYDGKLTIWGKRSESGVYELIPKDFWASHHIDNFSLWREHAVTTANSASAQGPRYFDLMVSRAQVERVLR